MPHFYTVFGLSVESELECPELLPAGAPAAPDIVIRNGNTPPALDHPAGQGRLWQAAAGRFLIEHDDLGSFYIHAGREIVIRRPHGVSDDAIRPFLLGACLSILMHQRRLFVLHCSGIVTDRGAVLFSGQSGSGKSTMVGAFLERGYKILADDMLALAVEGWQVVALPGFPQVKLWADSAEALGRSTQGLRRVLPAEEKYIAPERERFSPIPAPLHAIYDLRAGEVLHPTVDPLAHVARFNILLDHTWQKATLKLLGVLEWHFETAARIASLTYAARLTRPQEPLDVQRTADVIEADMQRVLPLQ